MKCRKERCKGTEGNDLIGKIRCLDQLRKGEN